MRFEKASLGEGLTSCDVCGHVDKAERFVSIYHGPHGEKVDYCIDCFDTEIRGNTNDEE
ncbi:MAG: hypothetical protein QXH97_01985 [Candidatus Bathyarchaeia archaeon]